MAASPSNSGSLSLLDLSPDLLLRIVSYLPLVERLRLPEVCLKLRQVLAGPSEAWRQVEAGAGGGLVLDEHEEWPPSAAGSAAEPARSAFQSFCRWLGPRLAGVEELRLAVDATRMPQDRPVHLPGDLLACGSRLMASQVQSQSQVQGQGQSQGQSQSQGQTALPLAKLSLQWRGTARLGSPDGRRMALPCLKKLAFPAGTRLWVEPPDRGIAQDLPSLTDFGMIEGLLVGDLDSPWLPPSVTMLALAAVGLQGLPGVLAHLPRLQSLVLDHNFELGSASLDGLSCLTALQELNLSECALAAFPHQISSLSRLRILYLHNTFVDAAELAPADWDVLRALRHLIFLSISGNSLHHLPPVVEGLTQLQGLHLEDNLITHLPPGAPVLAGLRELLLDWRTALGSPTSLASATRLSRLVLNDHLALELGPGAHPEVVGALLRTLGALQAPPRGALRRLEDVVPEGLQGMVTSISAPVAHCLLHLGRACPRVELGTMPATNAGWTLSSLVAGLPHNDGLALLHPAAAAAAAAEGEEDGGDVQMSEEEAAVGGGVAAAEGS